MIIGIDASRANILLKTGTEYYCSEIIKWLSKIDQKNQYILYSPSPLKGDLANLGSNFQNKVIKFPKFWTLIRLSLEMLKSPPDVLFIPAHVLPLIHPKNSVVTIHDVAFCYFPELYDNLARKYLEWSTKFALKHAKRIIAVSQNTKKDLIKLYKADPLKISVVYNGYNKLFNSFRPEQAYLNSLKQRFNLNKPFILFVGRIERRKNVGNIVKAFNYLKNEGLDFKLVLAGKHGFGASEILKQIEESDFKDDIILPGYISMEDYLYLMHEARVFVFPSLYEGFGIPVLEAMASGTPVVCSNRNPFTEIGKDAALYIDPLKPEEIAKAILRIIADSNLRNNLIIKGKERAKEFSWEKCAKETLKILEEVRKE